MATAGSRRAQSRMARSMVTVVVSWSAEATIAIRRWSLAWASPPSVSTRSISCSVVLDSQVSSISSRSAPRFAPPAGEAAAGTRFPEDAPLVIRVLWEARWKLGRVFGWDDERGGLGARVPTLRDRFPADLRATPTGPRPGKVPFEPLYQLDDEWAAEMANRTVHAVMHLGWVPDGDGGYRGQMAVLVKPNGRRGSAYMAAIKPLRYAFVYPALLGLIGRKWEAGAAA
ncbi:DUF2867 domain-containing protein [Kribbella sp. NPDC056861]|uniref:DUF2867 domain-containing protein n=1 Tax=Kribbella sp. NPDC056861 TaxID=3154857 RepID=UPI003420EB09